MGKVNADPKRILPDVVKGYKDLYGDDLVSMTLYGSATGKDFQPGKSDINLMIVLTEKGIEQLDRSFALVGKWRKKGVAVPLFLTENYITTSLDVFPIEYLNFQNNHVHVFGKEILKDLKFNPEFIRLQCEREIKGKLLLLRGAFVDTEGKGKALKGRVKEALPALVAIFKALLHLKKIAIPEENREIVKAVTDAFDLEYAVFEGFLHIKEERSRISEEESFQLFKGCLKEMRKLSEQVNFLGG